MKEVQDILIGINEISLVLIERLKDGFQIDDVPAVWEKFHLDTDFHQKISNAVTSVLNLSTDLKTLTLEDKVNLVNLQLSYLPKIISGFKQESTQLENTGIEELKNALTVFNELVIFLISRFKDGFQIEDLAALWLKLSEDQEFKERIQDVFLSMGTIPTEVKNLTVEQSVELSSLQLSYIPKIVETLK